MLSFTHSHTTARRASIGLEILEDRTAPALLGQKLFPADHAWNQNIQAAPVATNSAAIINNIVSLSGNGRLHPDFGQNYQQSGADLYGIPVNVVHGNSTAKTTVVIDAYPNESDLIPAPIPTTVVLEGDYQSGPKVGVDNRGDSHLIVYDVDNRIAYEFYRASRPSENTDGKWHADQQTVWDMKTNTFRTLGWTSADAAGLSILAGLVRPDEALPVNQGGQGVIDHAIRFTLRNNIILDQYLYPASHTANPGNNNPAVQPPMGARFRLKASVDISQLNPQSQVVARAMKDYGMILADNGSNFFFSGASFSVDANNQQTLTWNDNDIQDSLRGLKSLHFNDFEVVDLTPAVTDLSVHSGPAGTSVTVTGRNFSGAAGRLRVLFGNTQATSVTVVDDAHVIAVAPAGSGTVDVRVLSGVTSSDTDNINSPIFGYGMSAITTSDRFTYANTNPAAATALAFGQPPSDLIAGPTVLPTVTVRVVDALGNLVTAGNFSVTLTLAANPGAAQLGGTLTRTSVGGIATFNDLTLSASGAGYTLRATATSLTGVTSPPFVAVVLSRIVPVNVPPEIYGLRPNANTIDAFVKGLYRLVLGRDADSNGAATWANLLNTSALSREQLVRAFWNSTENRTRQVTSYYRSFLGRDPDSAGLAGWVSALQNGADEASIVRSFLLSAESLASTDSVFVTRAYTGILGRNPDSTGLAGWVSALQSSRITRAQVVDGFLYSTEAALVAVKSIYLAYLRRNPDEAGTTGWVSQIIGRRIRYAEMAIGFLSSTEFFANGNRPSG